MFSLQLPSAIWRVARLFDPERHGVLNKDRDLDARPVPPKLGSLSVDLGLNKPHWASDDPAASTSPGLGDKQRRRARTTRFRNKLRSFGSRRRFPRHTKPSESAIPNHHPTFLKRMQPTASRTCMGCFDSLLVDTLSCGHKYCNQCIGRMASISIEHECSFPPKCCSKEVPLQKILRTLSPQKQRTYTAKAREYATPISRRHYCPAPDCAEWIPPEFLKCGTSSYACPYCGLIICSFCRHTAHASSDCPSDPELSMVLEEARIQQWQRCYNCGALVELTFGCNHITCICKAQFCYKCGNPWASCTCVDPTDQTLDFLSVVVNNTPNGDEEAELAAVITAVIRADRDDG